MANVFVNEDSLSDIADAIRSKLNVQTTYKPGEMAAAIQTISGGGITPTGTKSITENGTYDVTSYASANVNVPQGSTPTGTKQISITQNGTTTEDVSAYANAEITVNVSGGGGTTPTAALALKATLESIGFLVSEFNVATADAGNYLTVPHALGSIPSMIIAFNSELVTEASPSGYQLGCASGAKVGVDDNENRTYTIPRNQGSTYSLFTTVLAEATTVGFPTFGTRSQYNFCNGATANSVLLRNSGSGAPTKMVGTKWFLAVK